MLQYHISKQKFTLLFAALIFTAITGNAQQAKRPQPVWWFGESGAANFNKYRGTTQMLNSSLTVPTAFHKGDGVKPYISLLTEYRPNKRWGGMLNLAYDNRGGKFNSVVAPCNCAANLSTNISSISVEPSLRIAPFGSAFYLFAGPTISFNIAKSFTYTQEKQTDKRADWSDIRKATFSAQVGAGIDIPVSKSTSATQMTISPFASFQTDLGQAPRKVESWSVYTIRAGIALKFGTAKKSPEKTVTQPETAPIV
ncbi:MAG: outer membrane beta-barrel protein, partial [Ferruginibacter sp.]